MQMAMAENMIVQLRAPLRGRLAMLESRPLANLFPHVPSRYIGPIAMASEQEPDSDETPITVSADRPIVLIGMMGVGKTSIGRKLADRLHIPFVDADEEIEKAAGMTIAEIFERFGEDYFRDGERRVIARLIGDEPKVIATGGGAFVNDETRALILEKARSIWIDADIEVLIERVARRSHRPLLVGRNPRDVLTELGAKRNPIYAQANIHIRSDSSPHGSTVEQIMRALTP